MQAFNEDWISSCSNSAEVKAKALAAGIDGDPTVFVDGKYESGVTSDGG